MCKDQNLVSKQADSGSLSDRIAVSSEFQSTLVWTKKLFRPTVLQMLYQNTDQERDEIMNAKLDILKKENVDESDILKIFNYPAIYRKLLERDYKAMMKSFNDLFVRFPEFLPLSDQIKAKILSDAFESYVSNFINLNHKRDNKSGRIQSCSSVHGQCLNSAMMGFYVGMVSAWLALPRELALLFLLVICFLVLEALLSAKAVRYMLMPLKPRRYIFVG